MLPYKNVTLQKQRNKHPQKSRAVPSSGYYKRCVAQLNSQKQKQHAWVWPEYW